MEMIDDTQSCLLEATNALTRAKNAVASRKHKEAITDCFHTSLFGQQFMDLSSEAESQETVKMVDVLMDCGQLSNSLMQHETAMKCYKYSVRLILTGMESNSLAAPRLCKAVTSMVHIQLHLNDPTKALELFTQYSGYLIDMDLQEANDTIKACLGNMYLDVGQALSRIFHIMGRVTLEKGRQYLIGLTDVHHVQRYAHLLSILGCTYLKTEHKEQCYDYLKEALNLWKILGYPPEDCRIILRTMKTVAEFQLVHKNHMEQLDDDHGKQDLLELHHKFHAIGLGMDVADALVDIGKIGCRNLHFSMAVTYFEEALHLYQTFSPSSTEKISNILKFTGQVHYNDEQYRDSVKLCLESLDVLGSQSEKYSTTSIKAECYVVLALSYAKLQDFENTLTFYDKALKVKRHLDSDDLKLIQMYIGNLYFIKAVKLEKENARSLSQQYYSAAEQAFLAALRFSWNSLAYVNYGYYLLHQGEYESSVGILQHAYLNAVIDHGVKNIYSMEYPILHEDLRTELVSQKDFAVPATVMALFFKSMAQMKMGNVTDAESTVRQLQLEIQSTNYDMIFCWSCSNVEMKAFSYSLLAYCYSDLARVEEAKQTLQLAMQVLPNYAAAEANLKRLQEL